MNKRRLFVWFVDDQVWRLFSQASAQRSPAPSSASKLTSTHNKWRFNKTENFFKDNRHACIIHTNRPKRRTHRNKDKRELMIILMTMVICFGWVLSLSPIVNFVSYYSFSFGIHLSFPTSDMHIHKVDCMGFLPPSLSLITRLKNISPSKSINQNARLLRNKNSAKNPTKQMNWL